MKMLQSDWYTCLPIAASSHNVRIRVNIARYKNAHTMTTNIVSPFVTDAKDLYIILPLHVVCGWLSYPTNYTR